MLFSLHIENIALIRTLDIPFSAGFTAFTGETGAGKSIILDSIALLFGNRFQKELIRTGESTAFVEALFSDLSPSCLARCEELGVIPDEDGYVSVSRTVSLDGKSVCRVGTRHVPSSLLKELGAFLINIHGQHDNQDLLKKEKHLSLLDAYALPQNEFSAYSALYREYKDTKKELESLTLDNAQKERMIETLRYQIGEIAAMKLKPDEEDKLLEEKKKLSNREKITENALGAYTALSDGALSATEQIDTALSHLTALAKVTDDAFDLIERLKSAKSEVYDIAETLHDMVSDTDESPSARLDRIEQRLYDIQRLRRKYGATVSDVLAYLADAEKQLSDLELSDLRTDELTKKCAALEKELSHAAEALTNARQNASRRLESAIEEQLTYLEMPGARFRVQRQSTDFSPTGCDDVEFYVLLNAGSDFLPLNKTASGGELSRLMLAIKSVFAARDGTETLIFDEIDTGISGKTSRRIGIKLKETSLGAQVMCVTHSAQIASLADTHFFVSKKEKDGSTETAVCSLTGDERIEETARILSGIHVSDAARKTASELIDGTFDRDNTSKN